MNVAFGRWIPVITTMGKPDMASLSSVLTEGEKYADLAVRPHERVALMRLFLGVAHAALEGPKDYDEWCDVPRRLPNAVRMYLTEWKDWFELFHKERPWLQVAELSKNADGNVSDGEAGDWTPVSKLNFSYATGNNTTLLDHRGMSEDRPITLDETLLSMLTFQCFSPGGLISQVYWDGNQSGKWSKDGPCVPASMIHVLLRGMHLLETIQLNLPTYGDIQFNYGVRDVGRPVWEMMPNSLTDSVKVKNATETYVGRLVPMTRLIRLHHTGKRMLLGDGLVYPTFSDGFPQEPTAVVVSRQKEKRDDRALLSFRPAKALWRELAAIIAKRKAGEPSGPLSLNAIQDGKECEVHVAALARDQATIIDTVESVFHVPSRLRAVEGTAAYETEVKAAESVASQLACGVDTYRGEIDRGWEGRLKSAGPTKGELKAKLHAHATTHYWTIVEKNLPRLMAHIDAIDSDAAIPTREEWRRMLFDAAHEAYSVACGKETPRQMRAFVRGLQKVRKTKDQTEPNTSETGEHEK